MEDNVMQAATGPSLDPADWCSIRREGHRMLDDMFDYIENIRTRPVWSPIPNSVRGAFRARLPRSPTELSTVHSDFKRLILPYGSGNVHPRFMGWVQGGGSAVGMLAEMLAAGLNANLGGRDHIPIEVENQIVEWMRELFRFPQGARGLFVTGTSIANFVGVLIAKTAALGPQVRETGVGSEGKRLVAYASTASHRCVRQAMEHAGLGRHALRMMPVDERFRIKVDAVARRVAADRQAGLRPFLVFGTAGSVDTGAIDDLAALSALCKREDLWFHIDGAYGALGMLVPELAARLEGIEQADSIAFDFHKWGQVPYDAGFLLVRDGDLQIRTFSAEAAYLSREARGLAAGPVWPCDLGPDLSRGFRALKTWFTLRVYGADRLQATIARTCALARYLERRIDADARFELLAPVELNIVCFRYKCSDPDRINADVVADLHESGIAAPSLTTLNGYRAIRVAIVNHRTQPCDIDALVDAVIAFAQARDGASPASRAGVAAVEPPRAAAH